MLSQGLIEFLGAVSHHPRVISGELAGGDSLYELCHRNEMVEMHPISVTHNLAKLMHMPCFVSVNSAIEIDLYGQSNGEMIGATQISGVGGSLDYIEAASMSDSGFSILALSNFIPTIYFGLFTGFAMAVALIANLTLLPVLLRLMRAR